MRKGGQRGRQQQHEEEKEEGSGRWLPHTVMVYTRYGLGALMSTMCEGRRRKQKSIASVCVRETARESSGEGDRRRKPARKQGVRREQAGWDGVILAGVSHR